MKLCLKYFRLFFFRTRCTFFNFTSIAATEKRPLSYKTPQSFHRPHYCGVQTFPLEMHYGDEKLGENWRRSARILTPNETVLTFGVPVYGVKFHQNWVGFATVREVTDRQKDRQTDTGDFIICPMLCYSNGTDNKMIEWTSLDLLILFRNQCLDKVNWFWSHHGGWSTEFKFTCSLPHLVLFILHECSLFKQLGFHASSALIRCFLSQPADCWNMRPGSARFTHFISVGFPSLFDKTELRPHHYRMNKYITWNRSDWEAQICLSGKLECLKLWTENVSLHWSGRYTNSDFVVSACHFTKWYDKELINVLTNNHISTQPKNT